MTEAEAKPQPKKTIAQATRAFAARPLHRQEPTPPPVRGRHKARPAPKLRPVDLMPRVFPGAGALALELGTRPPADPIEMDALELYGEAGVLPRTMRPASSFYRAPVASPSGAPAVLGRLNKMGIRLQLTPAGDRFYIETDHGRIEPAVLDAIAALSRLLLATLQGTPLVCELEHDGVAPVAVTLLAGNDVASCSDHVGR
jgi:hypothetical protein